MNVSMLVPYQRSTAAVADVVERRSGRWVRLVSALWSALLQSRHERAADEVERHRFLFAANGVPREDAERELTRIRHLISGH